MGGIKKGEVSHSLWLEMTVEEAFDTRKEVKSCFTAINAMIAVGVGLKFELNACLNELFCKFCCILEVNVIVGKTVANKQITMKFAETVKR